MLSTMMNTPLGVTTLHRFGARHFASSRVGDYDGEQVNWRRYDEIDVDSTRLAHGLLGLDPKAHALNEYYQRRSHHSVAS